MLSTSCMMRWSTPCSVDSELKSYGWRHPRGFETVDRDRRSTVDGIREVGGQRPPPLRSLPGAGRLATPVSRPRDQTRRTGQPFGFLLWVPCVGPKHWRIETNAFVLGGSGRLRQLQTASICSTYLPPIPLVFLARCCAMWRGEIVGWADYFIFYHILPNFSH